MPLTCIGVLYSKMWKRRITTFEGGGGGKRPAYDVFATTTANLRGLSHEIFTVILFNLNMPTYRRCLKIIYKTEAYCFLKSHEVF